MENVIVRSISVVKWLSFKCIHTVVKSNIEFFLFIIGRGGSWMARPGQIQKNKTNMNILRQEKLIAEKKKEIEARMAERAKLNAQTTSKPVPSR